MIKGATRGKRVYTRKFDHDEAKRRKEAGESVASLAREYGVTPHAVWMVVSPKSKADNLRAQAKLRAKGRCERCGGWKHGATAAKVCQRCAADLKITTVTETTLQCIRCKEFKPDAEFPFNRAESAIRRGRHGECRACNTIARREHRQRNREADNKYQREYKRRRRAALESEGADSR